MTTRPPFKTGLAPLPTVPLTPPGPFKTSHRRSSRPAPRAAVAFARGRSGCATAPRRSPPHSPHSLGSAALGRHPRPGPAVRANSSSPQVSPSGPVIPYASVKPGRTGFDTEAGVRRSISLFETLLTTQVAGGPRLRRALARRAWPRDPWSSGPWARVSCDADGFAPSRAEHTGRHDPVTGLRRDPLVALLCTLDPVHPVTLRTFGRDSRRSSGLEGTPARRQVSESGQVKVP